MNGSAASRQNGDGTTDRLAVRLTRRAPGSDGERSPYKTVRCRATGAADRSFHAGSRRFA
ncbi:hypothetical protein C6P88_32190 [Burkholderia contaminans]|nr:hypothetical protein C6P88_32190 [Burkholderia contaminans]